MGDDDALIADQIAYYRGRATEYDATSPPPDDPRFADHAAHIRDELQAFGPRGRVLELAAGTGLWTGILAELADELTATDAAPEMLELNRAKVGDPAIRYLVADAFRFEPDELYDVVFFGFWLSHVPPARFDEFWGIVRRCLAPSGRVFFVDEARHGLWEEDWVDEAGGIVRRPLADGTLHRAVKVLWRPEELEARLRGIGWDVAVHGSGPFYWGAGRALS
jgi:SAM-dependent methyltransferase